MLLIYSLLLIGQAVEQAALDSWYSYEYGIRAGFQPKPRKYTEEMFFEGDQHPLNPMRYLPTPFHTKFAQERTALSQYIQQEAVGTRMRRWERPLHDFLAPYLRGTIERLTGQNIVPAEVEHRRDLDTLAEVMTYLRALKEAREPGPSPRRNINFAPARARDRPARRRLPQWR